MAYAVKGILEEILTIRKKNKEPPSEEGGSCHWFSSMDWMRACDIFLSRLFRERIM